ncbi:HNH endonuclease [Desulforhopalus singaporensis]|uniref:HNH endonuclease n=1 Tax=Desulforhopalus singaporensis TaxID=91360 RepID=A0A1H0UP74_9BACT|nr:HNH endonuclease [Desulforhopalus singaporensis]SDP67941.1 HNH endonuclease [Desulforhopalus singaporensis]
MAHDFLDFDAPDETEIRREKEKAKALRKTRWWQQKTGPGICYYCRKKVLYRQITMDHLVPLARGGRSTKDNLVPCCKTCNNLKKSMMPLEWEEYMEKMKK